jgi:hypothetical protein
LAWQRRTADCTANTHRARRSTARRAFKLGLEQWADRAVHPSEGTRIRSTSDIPTREGEGNSPESLLAATLDQDHIARTQLGSQNSNGRVHVGSAPDVVGWQAGAGQARSSDTTPAIPHIAPDYRLAQAVDRVPDR